MILVTGGAGLLGKTLIEMLLARGENVKAIYHNTPLPDFNSHRLQQQQCDILDVYALQDVMAGVTHVYQCAGLVSFSSKDEKKLYQINAEGTANMVNASLEARVQKFVHVSSVAALGHKRTGEKVNEMMRPPDEAETGKYGRSKYLGEMEVWRAVAEGLNAVIVNPVIILGPGDWNASSVKIFRAVYEGFPWYTTGSTGFVDVRDVAEAMMQLMNSDISAERFIINAENSTYRRVFNLIAEAFGKKPPSKKVTPLLAAFARISETIKSKFTGADPLLTKETVASAMANIQFDNGKLLQFLPGFTYRTLEDTVKDTCAVLQQKINN